MEQVKRTVRAMVQLGRRRLEEREFGRPAVGRDEGLLEIERCGICGSDVEQFDGDFSWVRYPVIPGHEPIGVVTEIGADAAQRWGVREGDRVIVEGPVPCRRCAYCAAGMFSSCPAKRSIGFTPTDEAPALWGGYAELLYLHPNATVHRLPDTVPLDIAAFYNALACGVSWASDVGGTALGDTVLVQGAGQRGIASAFVAKAVGAGFVIMTGLSKDAEKLAIARTLGVDATIDVEREDVRDRVAELTDGALADVVIDVVPNTAHTVVDAVELVKPRGTVVLAGMKGDVAVPGLHTDRIVLKAITLRGVLGKPSSCYTRAIRLLEAHADVLRRVHPRSYPLANAVDAIEDLAGRRGDHPICVSLAPHT
jgi:threonine dehydrogenase-like Zn-dependent dehydrogenase